MVTPKRGIGSIILNISRRILQARENKAEKLPVNVLDPRPALWKAATHLLAHICNLVI